MKERIQLNCAVGGDASGDGNVSAFQKCVEDGSREQLSEEANETCRKRAEAVSGTGADDEPRPTGSDANSGLAAIAPSDGTGTVPLPRRRPPQASSSSTPARSSTPKAKTPTAANNSSKNSSTNTSSNPNSNPTNRAVAPSPAGDIVVAQIEADRDVASCAASMSTATDCCNNPMNCTDRLNATDTNSLGSLGNSLRNGPTAGGLTGYCQQMNTLGYNAGNVNTGLSGICYGSHSSCSDTCGGLARKYKSYIDICNGCEAESLYLETLRTLSSRQASCEGLRGRSDQLAMTGLGTSNNQALANYCSQLAASSPSGSPSSAVKSSSPFINNVLASNCDANPESPDCRGLSMRDGKVGFNEKDRPVKPDDFNVGDTGAAKGYQPATQASDPGPGAKAGVVANNSGGQIPGAGNTSEAKLGPKGTMPKTQASSATGGEGEGGFRSGGYTTQPGVNRDEDDEHAMNRNIGGNGSQFESVDLRQFLPGGSRARRLAGMSEINAKEEDIFLRITNKMNEKCRLGVLWQCR